MAERKDVPCRYWRPLELGGCRDGDRCPFAHAAPGRQSCGAFVVHGVLSPAAGEEAPRYVISARSGAAGRAPGPAPEAETGSWEEEPSGDPRNGNWRRWPPHWQKAANKLFALYQASGCKESHRGDVTDSCSVDFALMTCAKSINGQEKRRVLPIRLMGENCQQKAPDPAKNHPWYERKSIRSEREGDWLTNDFFWGAFRECCRRAGREVQARPEDLFDFQHNKDYRRWTGPRTEVRGGLKYSIPQGWKRFSCRVKGKFGDNAWLGLDGASGEWAIAYHGTSYEALAPILDGGLIIGSAQAYRTKRDARTGETIGDGVYCTPSLAVAEEYAMSRGSGWRGTEIGGHNVLFVLQCRVRPDRIKRCHDEDAHSSPYWVVNSPDDIRPYGILVKRA